MHMPLYRSHIPRNAGADVLPVNAMFSLCMQVTDDGRGSARSLVLRHKHELEVMNTV